LAKTFKRFTQAANTSIKLPALDVTEPPEYARADGRPCPELTSLAPPVGLPPNILHPDSKFDRVLLGLALACNDLHDCLWVLSQTDRGRPKTPRLNGYDGGRMGLELWATRVLAGILNELLDAIKKNHGLLTSHDETPAILETMSAGSRTAWNGLLRLASAGQDDGDRAFLVDVRNNLSYHYYQPKRLAQGYKRAFIESPVGDRNRFAYVSQGATVKKTRFYFVDAAAQTAADISNEAPSSFKKDLRLVKLAETAANSAFAFVAGFLFVRAKSQERDQ